MPEPEIPPPPTIAARTIPAGVHGPIPAAARGARATTSGPASIPADILRDASKRLATLGLVVAGAILVNLAIFTITPALGGPDFGQEPFGVLDYTMMAMFALSLAVFVVARSERLSPTRTLNLGLVYEVALGIAIGIVPQLSAGQPIRNPVWGISEICIVILFFAVIVPNSLGKVAVTSFVVASMDPIGVGIAIALGKAVPEPWASRGLSVPIGVLEAYHMNYVAAALAVVAASIVNRLGREVRRARELGSYRPVERLGAGGMGEVWRARHAFLKREAAVKVIRPEALGSGPDGVDVLIQRFEREAQATAALQSPHSVELYDFGIADDGTFFYVMELLHGLNLDDLVRRFGPLPSERVAYLLLQICHSLADAHARGLVHRDVKPANVFVCRKGLDRDFVKVLDFGLVKSLESFGGDHDETIEGTVVGTPAFLAPETFRGAGAADARSDLYALGCVAYWLLTGALVFEGDTPLDVLVHHASTEAPRPSVRSELDVHPGLERVVLRCLQKDPAGRPQSAAALAIEIGETGLAGLWTPERARRWWDTHVPGTSAGGTPAPRT